MGRSSSELTGRVFNAWHAVHGDELRTADEVLAACANARDPGARELYEALQAVFPDQLLNAKRLGVWLRAARGEIVGPFRLDGDRDKHASVWHWRIVRLASEAEVAAEIEAANAAHAERAAEFDARVASAPSLKAKLKLIDAEQRRQRKRAAAIEKIIAGRLPPGPTPRVKTALEAINVATSTPSPVAEHGPTTLTFTFLPQHGSPSASTARSMARQHFGVRVNVGQTKAGQYVITIEHDDPARLAAIRGELTRRYNFASIHSGPPAPSAFAAVREGTERHLAELGVTRDTGSFDPFVRAELEQASRASAERAERVWVKWIG